MMTIHIQALTFDTIIGLLDFEREHTQQVIIDLEADYHYDRNQFIDYAELSAQIVQRVKNKRYTLLEEALLDLETIILDTYPHIQRLFLRISKPDILPHCRVALSRVWYASTEK
jgi:dihydroneopterin aldolase